MNVELLCLANSKKHGGRCVAGIKTDGTGWLRPVATGEDGALFPQHYRLPDGSEPRVFDLLRIELCGQLPKPHQPENWVVAEQQWKLIARPARQLPELLRGCIEPGPVLFGNVADRVSYDDLLRTPARSSLALVVPLNLKWHLAPHKSRGTVQARAHFELGSASYDLVVTDPECLARLDGLAPGSYLASAAGLASDQVPILTISLGEPYEGHCYKLVAAVMGVPPEWLATSAPAGATTRPHRQPPASARAIHDPHLAEFARNRSSTLGRRLVEAFSLSSSLGETEDEAVQRLRAVLENTLREGLGETARH